MQKKNILYGRKISSTKKDNKREISEVLQPLTPHHWGDSAPSPIKIQQITCTLKIKCELELENWKHMHLATVVFCYNEQTLIGITKRM